MPSKVKDCPFLLISPPEEISIAYELVQKFLMINGIKLKNGLKIKLDFSLPPECCGLYFYKTDACSIYIDPQNCTTIENYTYGLPSDNNYSYFGYSSDLTMVGVTIHEFSHFLSNLVYPGIVDEYKSSFPTKRVFLNHYASTDAEEELTELMRLYIENPILLRLIDANVYRFLKARFKSPIPCSDKQFYKFYRDYPEVIKNQLKTKWGIGYNVHTQRFVKE